MSICTMYSRRIVLLLHVCHGYGHAGWVEDNMVTWILSPGACPAVAAAPLGGGGGD